MGVDSKLLDRFFIFGEDDTTVSRLLKDEDDEWMKSAEAKKTDTQTRKRETTDFSHFSQSSFLPVTWKATSLCHTKGCFGPKMHLEDGGGCQRSYNPGSTGRSFTVIYCSFGYNRGVAHSWNIPSREGGGLFKQLVIFIYIKL